MKTLKSQIALVGFFIFALVSHVQGEIVRYHFPAGDVYYCRVCQHIVSMPHTEIACAAYQAPNVQRIPESQLLEAQKKANAAGNQSPGGGSAAPSGNSAGSKAQQAGATAANLLGDLILQNLANNPQSGTPAPDTSKEEEQKRQQAFDKAVADQKRNAEDIKALEKVEEQLDGLGQDTLDYLRKLKSLGPSGGKLSDASQKQKPSEQKPKLTPEQEAELNDFNKFTTDSPDKYSEKNNYNQDVLKWKNSTKVPDGELRGHFRSEEMKKEEQAIREKEFYHHLIKGTSPKDEKEAKLYFDWAQKKSERAQDSK